MEICQSQYGGTTPQVWADLEGGTGSPDPLENHKIYGLSIGNKQLDPAPWKKLESPSGTLENNITILLL